MKTSCKHLAAAVMSAMVLYGFAYAEVSTQPIQGVTVKANVPVAVLSYEEMKKSEASLPLRSGEKRLIPLKRRNDNHAPATAAIMSPAVQSPAIASSVETPSLLTSFAGMDLSGNSSQSVPPDTQGAAGPAYLMSTVNGGVAYYNKTTGAVTGHITDSAFWSSLGSGSGQPADGVFDPKVIYDQYLGRFIFVELAKGTSSTNSYILIGVSSSSDPTGTWTLHAIRGDLDNGTTQTANWADYPGVGMDANNLYITVNMFTSSGTFQYIKIYSIPKTQLTSASPTMTYTEFKNNNTIDFTVQPCIAFGSGQQIYFVGEDYTGGGNHDEDSPSLQAQATPSYLKLFTITNNAWTPLGDVVVNSYPALSDLPTAPQLGSSQNIATNDTRMLSAVCRGGYVWATHTVTNAAATKTEIAWYQVDPSKASLTLASAGGPVQEGRVSDTSLFYYFPSIAVNANGDAALGFSGSSSAAYASAYYTARLSTDTAGTMQTVGQLAAGAAPYYLTFGGTKNRWGDYSATCVDPSDDLTFWTLQEYAKGSTNWGTWWGSFMTSSSGQYTLSVTKAGTGSGAVTLSSGTLSWSGTIGTASYASGTSVILQATADSSSNFKSWSGCDKISGNLCKVAMTAARAVTVTFAAMAVSDSDAASGAFDAVYSQYASWFGYKSGSVQTGTSGGATYYAQWYTNGAAIVAGTDGALYVYYSGQWYSLGITWRSYGAAATKISSVYSQYASWFGTKSGAMTSGVSGSSAYYIQWFSNGAAIVAWTDGLLYTYYNGVSYALGVAWQ
ncbi:MAG: hypothetical protein L7F77_01460 [Candidatus Magnetominusculus sp. LBB02]|nr:hypothetical protein [Candidatus Magnetominusculus sp. LBB02]